MTNTISGVFGPPEAPAASAAQRSDNLGKEEFLRLLVTQLSNQDPLNPMQGQEFAAQLAQFSTVEQLIGISQQLDVQAQINGLMAQSINSGVAAGLIGKTIEAAGNQAELPGTGKTSLSFALGAPATNVTISIRDQAGNLIQTLPVAGLEKGVHRIEWDGNGHTGGRVPAGIYSYEVNAVDENNHRIPASTQMAGMVNRVTFSPEGILLWIGGISVPIGAVQSVDA